jgi:hypothetical protein
MSIPRSLWAGAVAGLAVFLSALAAGAFCGFFVAGSDAKLTNNASQVILMRKGNRTVMTMSNNYQGPLEDFAMVVPVPVVLHKEDVKTLPADVFDRVDTLSAPRLVEYWEQDPCSPPERLYAPAGVVMDNVLEEEDSAPRKKDLGVKVEARFVTGEYEVVILSATESSGLETWLRQGHYNIPRGAAAALAPYVRDRSKFFVAKVNIKKVQRDVHGAVQLSPLRFAFDASELRLPVRLGLLNAAGKQDLIVYVVHPTSRFEVANYPNVFIPTNLEVADGVRQNFPAFYAELFDATIERMGRKAVVTEYAWQTTSCDPCPTPPLSLDDLSTLGLDVIEGIGAAASPAPPQRGRLHEAERHRARSPADTAAVLWRAAVVGADAASHPLQQGDSVRGSDLPRSETRDRRPRQLERHQRRRGRVGDPRRGQQLPGSLHHPPLLGQGGRLQGPAIRPLGRTARRSVRQQPAHCGQGASDRAARADLTRQGGPLSRPAARHSGARAAAPKGEMT